MFNDAIAARRAAREAGALFPPTPPCRKRSRRRSAPENERVWLRCPLSCCNRRWRTRTLRTGTSSLPSRERRKGRRVGAPRIRSKRDRAQSIRFTRPARFKVTPAGRLRLPGIGAVRVRWSRDLPGEASSVTVTIDATGRYHASFVVDVPDQPFPAVDREVGIDLGLTHFAVLSDAGRSTIRGSPGRRPGSCAGRSRSCPVASAARRIGPSRSARSQVAMRGSGIPAGTGYTSCRPR